MASLLRRIFLRKPAAPVAPVEHPVHGRIVPSEECEWWVLTAKVRGRSVRFGIGEQPTLAPEAVAVAERMIASFDAFESQLAAFLAREAATTFRDEPGLAAEIADLELDEIILTPESNGDGMVWLRGSNEHRLWRCDYRAGRLEVLGFDS